MIRSLKAVQRMAVSGPGVDAGAGAGCFGYTAGANRFDYKIKEMDQAFFKNNREKLLQELRKQPDLKGGIVLLKGSTVKHLGDDDAASRFSAEKQFYYLFGMFPLTLGVKGKTNNLHGYIDVETGKSGLLYPSDYNSLYNSIFEDTLSKSEALEQFQVEDFTCYTDFMATLPKEKLILSLRRPFKKRLASLFPD